MPQYFSPGVYVEEVDAGPRPIQGVSTSVTGAVGVTATGPSDGKPVLVTSYGQFVRIFGGPLDDPPAAEQNRWALDQGEGGRWWQFALAVKGFFDNGGQQLFVKRVFSGSNNPDDQVGATRARGRLGQGVISELTRDADPAATTIRLRHLLGIAVDSELQVFSDGRQLEGTFKVKAYNASGEVTLEKPVGKELEAERDFVRVKPSDNDDNVNPNKMMTAQAKSVGVWGGNDTPGNGLSVRVRPMVGATLRILADPDQGGPAATTQLTLLTTQLSQAAANGGNQQINVADTADFAVGDTVAIQGGEFVLQAVEAGPPRTFDLDQPVPAAGWPVGTRVTNLTRIQVAATNNFAAGESVSIRGRQFVIAQIVAEEAGPPSRPALFQLNPNIPAAGWPDGTPVARMRPANQTDTAPTLRVSGASSLYRNALVELDNGSAKERFTVQSVDDSLVTFGANVVNAYFEGQSLRVIEAEVNARYRRDGAIEADETFTNLRLVDDGSFSDIVRHVNERSQLIDLQRGPDYTGPGDLDEFPSVPPSDPQRHFLDLNGGADNYAALTVDDFVGVDRGSENRTGVQALEDIDDISLVLVPGMWAGTIRDAVIRHCDAMKYRFAIFDPPDGLDIQQIRAFRAPIDTRFAAIYYPWIVVRNAAQQRFDTIGPSAHMAGLYARVDTERGFHKAPANEVIRGIRSPNPATRTGGIERDVTKREQDLLNPEGINALRFFPGRGQRVWGARTLSSDSNWRYINVRRIFTFIERSIDEGTQFVVFEPNDEQLWSRVRQTVSNFLNTQWRAGVLEGATAEEAYFVACDRGVTMTQDDIENGRLICEVGIAPVYPAEFVIFRIQKFTAESKLA